MPKFKILVCDDSTTQRRTVEKYLKAFDVDVVHANNGEEAITYLDLHEGEFDLITLDDEMPKLNGLQTLQKLKEMKISTPPILMLATEGKKELVLSCLKQGANDYILKATQSERLIEKVALHLNITNEELVKKSYLN